VSKSIPILLSVFSAAVWASNTQVAGIHNFEKVNDHIYRGAQPKGEAWHKLAAMGVQTVIDLRREGEQGHSLEAERKAVEAAGMRYVSVPMNGIVAPRHEDVDKVLALMNSGQRVFIHCREGRDRTGTVVACYRIAHDRWSNHKALKEANDRGLHWFEFGMKGYIKTFEAPTAASVAVPATAAVRP
jgi:protein tyrosine phosphatase (PTP) superfamily phosphohydrolase (DUF442 family)